MKSPELTTSDISEAVEILRREITSEERNALVEQTPFSLIDGYLGDAYTAASFAAVYDSEEWREIFLQRIELLIEVLKYQRFDDATLLGGLSGLVFLLSTSRTVPEEFGSAIEVLTRRIRDLSDRKLRLLDEQVSMRRSHYDYASGVAGVAYLGLSCESDRMRDYATKIVQKLAEYALGDFPENFWTAANDLDEQLIDRMPQASRGVRDLGFAHGIGGVLRVLALASDGEKGGDYEQAFSNLYQQLLRDIERRNYEAVGYFDLPDEGGDAAIRTPNARNAWCYGLPSVELALSGRPEGQELTAILKPNASYLQPADGGFNGLGVCHGIAGRIYLADKLGTSYGDQWDSGIASQVTEFVSGGRAPECLSFWHGMGGTLSVIAGREASRYPHQLSILGV